MRRIELRSYVLAAATFFAGEMARAEGEAAPSDPKAPTRELPATNAQAADSTEAGKKDEGPKRRSGVAVVVTGGAAVATTSGSPNDAAKLDDPAFQSTSGAMIGGHFGFALMGALSDYVNVGPFVMSGSFSNPTYTGRTTSGGLRVEAFPFAAWRRLDDLGFSLSAGIGVADLVKKAGDGTKAVEIAQSQLGVGAFYELRLADLLGGHAVFSPGLQADFTFGRSGNASVVSLAGRLAFYGGP